MTDLVANRVKPNHYAVAHVSLKGTGPGLLMNRYDPVRQTESKKMTTKKKDYISSEDAERSAYLTEIDGVKTLYVPALCVYSMIVQACSGKKVPNPNGGMKVALRGIIAGSVKIEPERIPLGTDKYEIDVRGAVVKMSKIPRSRAWLPTWGIDFDLWYDTDFIGDPKVLLEILDEAGSRLGLMDYRPQHQGPFGTFEVTRFEV